ncbi:tyrosine-type recombinase/integrase [Vibrio sp. RW]|uniref:tyrosine-type recombinase/integrase n=1 Tax=Vibrio sp. RW TaxID=2998833 RepID=UPI0022CD3C5F|nr:tyrosine-type recombinase/integrase [Vibrio sp. RW]MDA0146181.1 tyrosine-type recombinase/integrase [Vibrio sp. RW]
MANEISISPKKYSLQTVSRIKELQAKAKADKDTVSRFKVEIPNLTGTVDPNYADMDQLIENMRQFELNRGGLSENSQRNLFSTLRSYLSYCARTDIEYPFPVDETLLYYWFIEMQLEEKKSFATLMARKNLMSVFLRLMGFEDPMKGNLIGVHFKSLKRDMAEKNQAAVVQKVAVPFRQEHLKKLIPMMCEHEKTGIRRLRDLCVMIIAYCTGLREGEVGTILRKNITSQNGVVTIRRVVSKTSSAPISKSVVGEYARILGEYLELVDIAINRHNDNPDSKIKLSESNTYIFSWIRDNGTFREGILPMPGETIDRIFERAFISLNPELPSSHSERKKLRGTGVFWTGHSGRVGAVIDAKVLYRMNEPELMAIGDWTNMATVMRYLRATGHLEASNITIQNA